jgi:hypothetical protein
MIKYSFKISNNVFTLKTKTETITRTLILNTIYLPLSLIDLSTYVGLTRNLVSIEDKAS